MPIVKKIRTGIFSGLSPDSFWEGNERVLKDRHQLPGGDRGEDGAAGGQRSRRAQRIVVLLLAAAAVVAGARIAWLAAHARTEADLLVEVLAGSDPGDAAWAFARLREIDDRSLEHLLPHLTDQRPTSFY